MNRMRRTILAIYLVVVSVFASGTAGFAADPLPGTCGLPSADALVFAFAGPNQATDVPVFSTDLMSCQAGTMDMSFVQGCGPDYYVANPGHGALNLRLAEAGFRAPNGSTATLMEVINGAQDPYLAEAVTAYLNSLYVDGYEYDAQNVLDGYHSGDISEGNFAWNNHGSSNQFVIHNCPLSSLEGASN